MRLTTACLAVVIAGGAAVLGGLPIAAYDQDLWSHLAFGRYILTRHALPAVSFVSFLQPPRPALNVYAWLFQTLVYAAFHAGGYGALIALRAASFLVTVLLVARLLREPRGGWSASGCALVAVYAWLLLPRFLVVRPQLVTYPCLCACLLAVEGEVAAWLIPPLALVWANAHGIEYPVAFALFGVLALKRPGPAAASAAAFFCTPLGWRLLPLPFASMPHARALISEIQPLRLAAPGYETVFFLVLAALLLCAAGSLARRDADPARLLLLAVGLVLLTRGSRFQHECMLLGLPLLKDRPRRWPAWLSSRQKTALAGGLVLLLAGGSVLAAARTLRRRGRYPLSRAGLPVGVAAFLAQSGESGKIWNDPDFGGYLEWSLPQDGVAADLQTPFLFTDDDVYAAWQSFHAPAALQDALSRWRPDFIVAPLQPQVPALMSPHPDYVLAFYDDAAALYVDAARHRRLARAGAVYGDPFERQPLKLPARAPRPEPFPPALARMIAIDPGCLKTRWRAARLCASAGDYAGELANARAIEDAYPDSPFGWLAEAHALAALGRSEASHQALLAAHLRGGKVD